MLKQFLNKFKKLFINSQDYNKSEELLSKKAKEVRKNPALIEKNNKRFLSLANDDCALILHAENQCEVVFTKLYDQNNQNLTQNEELLMALAIFLKQQGFGEMLLTEFHKIALNNTTIFKDEENKRKNN